LTRKGRRPSFVKWVCFLFSNLISDIKLVPWLCVISIITFIDRINIGNARIQGLEADLGLTGIQYNIALFIFFVPSSKLSSQPFLDSIYFI
jgi:hypothetical protein